MIITEFNGKITLEDYLTNFGIDFQYWNTTPGPISNMLLFRWGYIDNGWNNKDQPLYKEFY